MEELLGKVTDEDSQMSPEAQRENSQKERDSFISLIMLLLVTVLVLLLIIGRIFILHISMINSLS